MTRRRDENANPWNSDRMADVRIERRAPCPSPRLSEHGEPRFVDRVFEVVRRIPPGRVTTYGRIAKAVGTPRSARMVGWALHNCPPDVSEIAHRVVNRYGELSGGWSWGHPAVMRALLEDEGITFVDDFQVDLARHLWEPGEEGGPT